MEIITFIKNNEYDYFKLYNSNITYLHLNGTYVKKKNGLIVNWDDNNEEIYYLINNVYVPFEEIKNTYVVYKILMDNYIKIFYSISNILINLEDSYKFKFINDVLILNIKDDINVFYNNDKILNYYNLLNIPNDFDLKTYQNYTNINFENWYDGLEHYMTLNHNINYQKKIKIFYLNKIQHCIINLSHEYLLMNNQYYKFFIKNDILNLDINTFEWINNEVIFKNNTHTYIQFIIQNDIYIECVNNKKIVYYYGSKNYIINTFIQHYEITNNIIFVEYDDKNLSNDIYLFDNPPFEINLNKIIYIYDSSWKEHEINNYNILYESYELKNLYSFKNLNNEHILNSFYILQTIDKTINNDNFKIGIFGGNVINLIKYDHVEFYDTNKNLLFYDFVEFNNINAIIISFEFEKNYEFLKQAFNSKLPILFENLENIQMFINENIQNNYTYKFKYLKNNINLF